MFGIQDTVILEFIILSSKTMSEVKNGLDVAMVIHRSLSHSFCLLMDNQKDSEERSRNVEVGSVMHRVIYVMSRKLCT